MAKFLVTYSILTNRTYAVEVEAEDIGEAEDKFEEGNVEGEEYLTNESDEGVTIDEIEELTEE